MKKDPREHTKFRIVICRYRFLTDQKKRWEGSKLETMFDIIGSLDMLSY